jgi:hypothetical protein
MPQSTLIGTETSKLCTAPSADAPRGLRHSASSEKMYSNLDSRSGKCSRVFNDALSVVGKPNGLRASEWNAICNDCDNRSGGWLPAP